MNIENLLKLDNPIIIDVREPYEFNEFHLENSTNIPLNFLISNPLMLNKSNHYYIICAHGIRSHEACNILRKHDIDCTNIEGGIQPYKNKD